jgi:hypothetical protein
MLLHRPDRSPLLDRDHFLGVASKDVDLAAARRWNACSR